MPPSRLLRERTTRSLVFEEEVIHLLEQYAAARQRSLSSVVREAVVKFLDCEDPQGDGLPARGPGSGEGRTNGKVAGHDPRR